MVAGAFVNENGITQCSNCPYLGFVLVAFLDSDQLIGIPRVLLSISQIRGRGYQLFTVALLRAQ